MTEILPKNTQSLPKKLGAYRNNRVLLAALAVTSVAVIGAVLVLAAVVPNDHVEVGFGGRNEDPSSGLWLGTDWLGRDMFARLVKGLRLSIGVGIAAAILSVVVATVVAGFSSLGVKAIDRGVNWIINCFLGLLSVVLMLILAFAFGGGLWGIVFAVGLSTWTHLARVLQSQVLKVRSEGYVMASLRQGRSRPWIAVHHVIPSLTPHIVVGLAMGLPHAILHEAMLSFLGFGFDPSIPSLGIILNEALRYITSGQWWLILWPVVALVGLAVLLDQTGDHLRRVLTPSSSQE